MCGSEELFMFRDQGYIYSLACFPRILTFCSFSSLSIVPDLGRSGVQLLGLIGGLRGTNLKCNENMQCSGVPMPAPVQTAWFFLTSHRNLSTVPFTEVRVCVQELVECADSECWLLSVREYISDEGWMKASWWKFRMPLLCV